MDEASEEIPSGKGKGPRAPACLICGEDLSRRDLVLCRDCHAPHHERCWTFNRGCATYACNSRVFVAPPGGPQELMELEVRGRPNLFALLSIIVGFGVLSALLKPYVLVSKAVAKPLLKALKPLFWTGVLTTILGPLITRRRYLLDPVSGKVGRALLVGPVRLLDDRSWKEFDELAGLEVRLAEVPGKHAFEARKGVEVWLREVDGTRHLLDRGSWEDRDAVLRQAAEAAELLDTTLGLPRGVAGEESLPAGLSATLAGLPRGAAPELPEETGE